MKITRAQLKQIIKEEIEAIDEGILDRIKGMFGKGGSSADLAKYAEMFPNANERQLAAHVKRAAEVEGLEDFLDKIQDKYGGAGYEAAVESLKNSNDYIEGRCSGHPTDCAPFRDRGVFEGEPSPGNWRGIVNDKKEALVKAKDAADAYKRKRDREDAEYRGRGASEDYCDRTYKRGTPQHRDCLKKRSQDRADQLASDASIASERGEYGYHASQEGSWGLEERLDRIAQKVEERMVRRLRKKK